MFILSFFFFKQKTAYEMRISDWSSDVCSSDLSIIMKAIWLARRDDWSRLITPISGTRAVFTLGARSHQSNLAQPKGKSEPFRGFSTSLRSGNVIMKATEIGRAHV